ncbi:MAG: hypothetical protein IMW91_00105 [Firmicutes bacterium]|nr:hypothetical protein [Bacillota bacterium]
MMANRVTLPMLQQQLLAGLSALQSQLQQTQSQMTTGYRISFPSQDPGSSQLILQYNGAIAQMQGWQQNAQTAVSTLQATDGSVGELQQVLQRARTLAIQGENGAMTATDQAALANEMRQLYQQAVTIANTTFGDQYLFGGTSFFGAGERGPAQPSAGDLSPVVWSGNGKEVMLATGSSTQLASTANGQDVFDVTGTSSKLLDALYSAYQALENGDATALGDATAQLDQEAAHLSAARARIGAQQNQAQATSDMLAAAVATYTDRLHQLADTDMAQAITTLNLNQTVYQAALATGARMMLPSLADYLA